MTYYDRWLDRDLDDFYSEDEPEEDEEWKIDRYVEDQERESFDEYD